MKWSSSARVENVSIEKLNQGLLIPIMCHFHRNVSTRLPSPSRFWAESGLTRNLKEVLNTKNSIDECTIPE